MTTRTERLPLVVVRSGSFAWRRLVFSFFLTLSAVALFVLAFAAGYVRMHEGRALPGVEVAGVSLAGLDRLQAESLLRERLPALSSGALTVRFGEEQATISYSDVGRDYDMAYMLDQAFAVGHGGGLPEQAIEQLRIMLNGVAVEPALTWNAEELGRRVAQAALPAQIAPVDARVVRTNGHYEVVPAAAGQSVDVRHGLELASLAINNLSPADTQVAVEAVSVAPSVSTETASAAVERMERVVASPLTVSGGGGSAVIGADHILGWVQLVELGAGAWDVVIPREPIAQFVEHYAMEVDVAAVDASFAFEGGNVVAVRGENGQALDREAGTDAILAALQARADGGGPPQVTLAVAVVEPEFSSEQAQSMADRVELLSSWRTNFVPGILNANGRNISVPTTMIDGTVVRAGQTFDFWRVVGMPTLEDGYGYGGAIIRGRTVPDETLAGGICSCSTTIFNAALRAGLEMGARKNHYYYIARYPVGLDATVWIANSGARQTMRFTNDTDYPLLVRGINRRGAVIFEIWGIDDGRTVSFSRPVIENRRSAFEVLRYTDNLAPGVRRRVEWPVNGFDSTVVRTVHDANGRVIHRDVYFSRYAMIKGITLVGRSPGDPRHGTEVRR
ncbi:MAG TPA: VanW family protein [Candidatus Limnocylindria bacterium]|nr:VanW family protein [Candidatus Limnocylindria bacterium]